MCERTSERLFTGCRGPEKTGETLRKADPDTNRLGAGTFEHALKREDGTTGAGVLGVTFGRGTLSLTTPGLTMLGGTVGPAIGLNNRGSA